MAANHHLSSGAYEQASKIYKELRQAGKTIGEFDILIAAITMTFEEKLVSRDSQFELVRGLGDLELVGKDDPRKEKTKY